jgi:hypothetical protein
MLTLDARRFIEFIHTLLKLEQSCRGLSATASVADAQDVVGSAADYMIKHLDGLDLPVSRKTVEEMILGAETIGDLHAAVKQLWNTFALELDGRKFYGPLRHYEKYYEQPKLFGDEVFTNFPNANNDIFEAGTCLALERGTACVMHLMRVCEVGIKALAAALSVGPQNDWGAYFREIDKALDARAKAAGKRTPDEQFYAEVRVTLDGVRMAWRNATMHVENNYSPERAEEILIAVRSLMRHLATKLSE